MKVKTKTSGLIISMITLLTLLSVMIVQPISAAVIDTGETPATVIFESGDLEVLDAPVFNFDTHVISGKLQEYPSKNSGTSIKISDLRGARGGWELNVSLTPFTLADESESIQGAYIEITNASVSGVNGNSTAAPTINEEGIKIVSNKSETPILTAADGEGRGVWELGWAMEDAKLSVLAGTAQEGKHEATLTWSLLATP